MTTKRLQFCLMTAFTIGVEVTAQAQQAPAPQAATPAPQAATPAQQAAPAQQGAAPQYPAGQPYPGQPVAPSAQYPAGQPYPAQPYPGQPYPAQPYPAQPYPGLPYPPPTYQGQSYPPLPYSGMQPYPQPLNTTVHIDSNDGEATLFQNTGSSAFVGYGYRGTVVGNIEFWQRICRAPCDQPVDGRASYSIRGNGIVASAPFSLPSGQARVNVQAGHTGPRIGGWLLASLGGATFLSGATLLGMGALFKSFSSSSLSSSGNSYMAAGGITMAIGAGALAGGIVLLIKSRTQVQINGQASAQLHLPGGRPLYVNAHGLTF